LFLLRRPSRRKEKEGGEKESSPSFSFIPLRRGKEEREDELYLLHSPHYRREKKEKEKGEEKGLYP